ncbi:MAG: hypothetical protein EAX90_00050 [Candidatus Heimdallarchaeota archaeon]|nr:hypothetical protein [Candidatus Heimdallarchaeota archaeon]
MIAITKEFKQMLQELFESRGVTEIPTTDLVEILAVNKKELEKLLSDEKVREEFKIVRANDGNYYVKRLLNDLKEVKTITSALKIQWDNIGGCPCFTCYELDRCDIGNPISSVDCPLFTKWLFANPDKEEEKE